MPSYKESPPCDVAKSLDVLANPRDQALSHAVLQAVLDGDYKRARCLAEEWRQLDPNALALRLVK